MAESGTSTIAEFSENKKKMLRGEMYYAVTPELNADRKKCLAAYTQLNNAGDASRRKQVELWRSIACDDTPLPPIQLTEEADEALFDDDPTVLGPVRCDYGYNVRLGANVFINSYCTFIDTTPITIGARTLVGPNVGFYSGRHPLDPLVRNGAKGLEDGKEIIIGEDCWIGGHAVVLPGVTLGRGVVIGAGSVVTRDIPAFHVAAGNPARILRKIETALDETNAL